MFLAASGIASAESEKSAATDKQLYLWVPSKMIADKEYKGLVVTKNPPENGMTVSLASDKDVVDVPRTITIMPESNHGIFSIKPLQGGTADLFAVASGDTAKATTTVYPSGSKPYKLDIFLPSNATKADKMPGFVFSLDRNGAPAYPDKSKDIQVSMSSTGRIDVPENIIIRKNQYHAKFEATIHGSGTISADTQELEPATYEISKISQDVQVNISVAPSVSLSHSQAYFYVWLEKEGLPFKPSRVIDVFLTSDNPDVASLTASDVKTQQIHHARLVDGIAKGTLFTRDNGKATITAHVRGFGSSQSQIFVGPTHLPDTDDLITRNLTPDNDISTAKDTKSKNPQQRKDNIIKPNVSLSWILPPTTSDIAYGVVATYWMSDSNIVPVEINNTVFNINSEMGIEHDSFVSIYDDLGQRPQTTGRLAAIEYEISAAKNGTYTVSASSPGVKPSRATLNVMPAYSESYDIKIIPLPSLPGIMQDVAMISLVDKDGNMVSTDLIDDVSISISDNTSSFYTDGSTVVVDKSLSGKTRILAVLDGISQKSATLFPSRTKTSINLDMPKIIHTGELFPFSIHSVDSTGVPINNLSSDMLVSTTPNLSYFESSKFFVSNDAGTAKATVLSDYGVASQIAESFSNTMNLELTTNSSKIRVGNPVKMVVATDVSEPELDVISPFSFTKEIDDKRRSSFLIYPDKEGNFDVAVTAKKNGYTPVTKTVKIQAAKLYDLSVSAVSLDDESQLPIPLILKTSNKTLAADVITPFAKVLSPSEVSLSLPVKPTVEAKMFLLQKTLLNNNQITPPLQEQRNYTDISFYLDGNTELLATYKQVIKVDIKDAEGGGLYPYGTTVNITAPPKEKISFLVRQVFDHWQGLPYDTNSVSFVAKEHISARAVYKDDYTLLMLLVAACATALSVFAFKEKIRQFVLTSRMH